MSSMWLFLLIRRVFSYIFREFSRVQLAIHLTEPVVFTMCSMCLFLLIRCISSLMIYIKN